jgi:hypothetical protein
MEHAGWLNDITEREEEYNNILEAIEDAKQQLKEYSHTIQEHNQHKVY